MKETGKIIKIDNNNCIIEIDANSGCHTCTLNSKCHASSRGKRSIEIKLKNNNFQIGDQVELETQPRSVLFASFLVFILPLIISIAAYLILTSMFSLKNYGPVIFFAFFIFSECIIFFIDKIIGGNNFFAPEIVRKLES